MQFNKIAGLLILLLVIVGGGWLLFTSGGQEKPGVSSEDDLAGPPSTPEVILETALLVIDNGQAEVQSFELDIVQGLTAFDLLKTATEQSEIELSYSDSEFGVFVEQIGQEKNGDDNKYWLYYVNGEMPMVAADKQAVEAEDIVEFKFEESPF